MKRFLLIIVTIIIAKSFLNAQSSLTLEECIWMAQHNSPAAIIAKKNYNSKKLNYSAFKAGFYPQVSFNASLPGFSRQITTVTQPNGDNLFIPQSLLYSAGNLTVSQILPWTGGSFTISSGISRIDALENNEYTIWRTTPISVQFSQPLFQYNSVLWDREIESVRNLKYEAEYYEAMEQVAIDAANKFFNLYTSQKTMLNSQNNVAINDTMLTLSKGRFNVGKIAENDLLQNELALLNAKNDYENAKLEYYRNLEDLKLFLGKNFDEDLELIQPATKNSTGIDPEMAVKEALENRSTITDYKLQALEAERSLRSVESDNGFHATLNASYGYNQSASELKTAYTDLLNQETFDIGISFPIFTWGAGSDKIESAMEYKKSIETNLEFQKKNFELDIKYQVKKLERLQNSVEISAKADTIARRRFEVATNRFIIGKIDLNSFYIAQNEKDNAFLNYINALRGYWNAYYELRSITLYDFEHRKKITY